MSHGALHVDCPDGSGSFTRRRISHEALAISSISSCRAGCTPNSPKKPPLTGSPQAQVQPCCCRTARACGAARPWPGARWVGCWCCTPVRLVVSEGPLAAQAAVVAAARAFAGSFAPSSCPPIHMQHSVGVAAAAPPQLKVLQPPQPWRLALSLVRPAQLLPLLFGAGGAGAAGSEGEASRSTFSSCSSSALRGAFTTSSQSSSSEPLPLLALLLLCAGDPPRLLLLPPARLPLLLRRRRCSRSSSCAQSAARRDSSVASSAVQTLLLGDVAGTGRCPAPAAAAGASRRGGESLGPGLTGVPGEWGLLVPAAATAALGLSCSSPKMKRRLMVSSTGRGSGATASVSSRTGALAARLGAGPACASTERSKPSKSSSKSSKTEPYGEVGWYGGSVHHKCLACAITLTPPRAAGE